MNRAEHKARVLELLNESDTQVTLEAQANVIAAAQVHATLATIPDDYPVKHDPWAGAETKIY